jgi:UDP:flavonoid glycosyltransferase YjiC (YdhE family)
VARILVASIPVVGHLNPLVPIVRVLCARGHDVAWYTGAKYRAKVEATGARWFGMTAARDYDDAALDDAFPGRTRLTGLAKLKFDMKDVFIEGAAGQLADVQAIAAEVQPQVLFAEAGSLGALFYSERHHVPFAVLGVIPLAHTSVDTAPFGLALAPSATMLGRLRNRALNFAVEKILFADVQRHWNATRARAGLPPTGWWLNAGDRAAVYLQPSIPALEHPRSDLPPNVRFIGMLPADAPAQWTPPAFWHELDGSRPVVHVTQGTIANTTPQLIAPALRGLAHEDVLVVVATGGPSAQDLGLTDVPSNARIAPFLSYPALLPRTSAMVTNGGYGGVQMALAHGVPLVVAGTTEDKPEVATRVAGASAGIDLRTATPSPERIRDAVRELVHEPRYRARAQALAAEYARYDAVRLAIEAVESLVTTTPR